MLLFSHQVVSDSLQPRVLQYTRLPGPSVSPGVCSNSCPLSWWCHLTISSSVKPFYFCSQSSPASVFSKKLTLHIMWPMYQSFSFSIGPSKEYLGLIFFRIDWFDLFAVQGTLKSLLQHHSSKAPILWHSVFFMVHFLHPYMTTEKTMKWKLISPVWLFVTPCTVDCQAHPSIEFFRQE